MPRRTQRAQRNTSVNLCALYINSARRAKRSGDHRHLPMVNAEPPQGGIFVWPRLPEGYSSVELLARGRVVGVEFAPGTRFFVDPADGERYLRLNFATQTPAEIEEGVRRLGRLL